MIASTQRSTLSGAASKESEIGPTFACVYQPMLTDTQAPESTSACCIFEDGSDCVYEKRSAVYVAGSSAPLTEGPCQLKLPPTVCTGCSTSTTDEDGNGGCSTSGNLTYGSSLRFQ